jgi:hypothetical protein
MRRKILRWAALVLALLGALAVLLPWVRTEIIPASGAPHEVGYSIGIPSSGMEGAVVGWNAVLASAAFAAFALLALAFPERRGRVFAVAGVVTGLVAIVFAALVFTARNPLLGLHDLSTPALGKVQIQFTPAVGPYAVVALGLALAAVSAALYSSAGDDRTPPPSTAE